MKENKTYTHPVFGSIRTAYGASNEPIINAADLCRAMGYPNANCVSEKCDKFDIEKVTIKGLKFNYLKELGVNDLAERSQKPDAQRVLDWINAEVYPDMRGEQKACDVDRLKAICTCLKSIQTSFIETTGPRPDAKDLAGRFIEHVSELGCICAEVIGLSIVDEAFR